jgi:hypothetical protein
MQYQSKNCHGVFTIYPITRYCNYNAAMYVRRLQAIAIRYLQSERYYLFTGFRRRLGHDLTVSAT